MLFHSPPTSADVKNAWSYSSTPPIRLHSAVLNESTGETLPLPLPLLNVVPKYLNFATFSKDSLAATQHITE